MAIGWSGPITAGISKTLYFAIKLNNPIRVSSLFKIFHSVADFCNFGWDFLPTGKAVKDVFAIDRLDGGTVVFTGITNMN